MFDNIKKSLGISKSMPPSKGHVLGRKDDGQGVKNNAFEEVDTTNGPDDVVEYDMTFMEEKLGMSVEEGPYCGGSRPFITKVAAGSEALNKGTLVFILPLSFAISSV